MKKKLICLLLCFVLLPVCAVRAVNDPSLPRVVDEAGILTDSEITSLTDTIGQISGEFQMDVVIVTVNSIGYKSAQDYADDYYDDNGYGAGSDYSGVLLLISMDDRQWWISTCGDAIYAITDYGVQALFSEMKPYLSADRFYEAFESYLDALPQYFEAFADGDPIDSNIGFYDGSDSYSPGTAEDVVFYDDGESSFLGNTLISLVIGLVVGLIAILIMRSSMNTKRPQHSAGDYLKQGSFQLTVHRDMFLYSNVSKTPRPKETHSGGSSVHRSSGGRSHGGGGGRF